MVFRERIKLARYTSIKIGGPARYFCCAKTGRDARNAILWAQKKSVPYVILGGGTNIVISDEGYRGLVMAMKNTGMVFSRGSTKGETRVQVEVGTQLQKLVDESLRRGLSSLEWAAGIPGQVGGAIRGNAGAFGGEIANALSAVSAVMPDGSLREFSNAECEFAYRTSLFKQNPGMVILSAAFILRDGDKKQLLAKAAEFREWRRAKHPIEYPNCGSMFKRIALEDIKLGLWERYPDMKRAVRGGQVATAYFIDSCGLKNMRMGGAQISEKHPNFFLNRTGRAKAEDVFMLVSHARTRVHEKFGIFLEEEPEFVFE